MTTPPDQWLTAPEHPVLGANEVHVWRAYLDREPSTLQPCLDLLAPDERQRADRFRFMKDRVHFVVARAALRQILARYLGTRPQLVSFSYNKYGKPALADGSGDSPLRFNVSHSNGIALYAFTLGREVGLDIEFMRDDFAGIEIAEHFFSEGEVATLRAVPESLRTRAFFNCWARKEAYIKARGEGLSHPLHRFAVSLAPGEPPALLRTDNDPLEASRWSLLELTPSEGYVAALVVEGPLPPLRCWQWK